MLRPNEVIFLLLLLTRRAFKQSELIGSSQLIVALAGDDVILPCYLEPPISASSETVEWTRPGLDPKYVHFHQDGKAVYDSQNASYYCRTALFEDQLRNGNVSLKLFDVKRSDEGKYLCILRSLQKEVSIQLIVVFNYEQSELIGSPQPIVALAGDDVILPCYLEPPISASSETVVWTRPDLNPKYVHFHQDGQLMCQRQYPSYYGRTALFEDQLIHGNVSLKIFSVKISDTGKYVSVLRSLQEEVSIQLIVGAVSTPVISGINRTNSGVMLDCKSEGWYPEPEVLWLDGEGNLLPAGPTETVRGPDDLYTVSSRVTVEKRHSNNFTCRVQQNYINQSRETEIHVPDDFFKDESSSHLIWIRIGIGITIALGIAGLLLLTLKKYTERNWRGNEEEQERTFQRVQMYVLDRT